MLKDWVSMSHIEDRIIKKSNPEVATWAKYEAAQTNFGKLRAKLI